MQYKNGREAKNGDKVLFIPRWTDTKGVVHAMTAVIGILYDAQPGYGDGNGKIAPFASTDQHPILKECLHLDDVLKALPAEVPDSSKQG